MKTTTELCHQKCRRIQASGHNQAGIAIYIGRGGGGRPQYGMVILCLANAVNYRAAVIREKKPNDFNNNNIQMVLYSDASPGVQALRDERTSAASTEFRPYGPFWRDDGLRSLPVVLIGVVLMINGSLSALAQVTVAIGEFNGLFCGSALLGLKSLPRPPA